MSTILKALRRLEEQKSVAAERPLRDEVVLTPRRAGRRQGLVVAICAAVAFALVGAALVALFDRVPAPGPARVGPGDVAASPDANADLAVADAATQVFVASPDGGPALRGSELPAASVSDFDPDFEVVRPASKPRPFIPTMQVDPIPHVERTTPAPGSVRPSPLPRVVAPEPIDDEIPTARVERAAAPVYVDRTQWHPSPERRVAWVEVEGETALREVHEGERVGPYVVRSIEPAAVLFSEGSVQLRREVGR